MAILSRGSGEVTATNDENADGRIDQRDDRLAARRAATEDSAVGKAQVDEGLSARTRLAERTATATAAPTVLESGDVAGRGVLESGDVAGRGVVESGDVVGRGVMESGDVAGRGLVENAGPRARASVMATLSLVVGVGAALTVLTGLLAGPGIGLGLIAAFLGIAGISATSRRHVAGKADAFLGIALGLGAIVVGSLALTGLLSWLSGDANQVTQVHDWLAARVSWLFP
jgi:hypothetical protein